MITNIELKTEANRHKPDVIYVVDATASIRAYMWGRGIPQNVTLGCWLQISRWKLTPVRTNHTLQYRFLYLKTDSNLFAEYFGIFTFSIALMLTF